VVNDGGDAADYRSFKAEQSGWNYTQAAKLLDVIQHLNPKVEVTRRAPEDLGNDV
jgi:hypothetical protein